MNPMRSNSRRFYAAPVAILLVLAIRTIPGNAAASENLLLNPDPRSGSSMPAHWHPSPGVECDSFEWSHQPGAPGELRISNAPGGRAAWTQKADVSPGWYYLSASLRTEGLGRAFLSVRSSNLFARSAWASTDWERHGLYIHIRWNDHMEVECGLDSPSPTATASFRDIILSRISGAPPAATQETEIDQAPSNWASIQRTQRRINISLLSLLCMVGLIYYRFANGGNESLSAEGVSNPPPHFSADGAAWSLDLAHDRWRIAGVVASFGLLLVMFVVLSRIKWSPGAGFSLVAPAATRSDEPQYVLVINSLLFDHDLQLQDDYDRVASGGFDAGVRFSGAAFDHHTILINRRSGRQGLASIDAADHASRCDSAFNPPEDVYEVSAHPVAFPALIALAIAPLRPSLTDVESYAAVVLALISWLGALVTYLAGRRLGMSRATAMLATMLLVGASPWLAYSRSFFSESTIGLALILTVWAFSAERVTLAGFGAGFAAILKPPFAVVGAGLIINELIAGRRRNAAKLAIGWGSCGTALIAFNYWLAKTPVISGNLGLTPFAFYHFYDTFLDPVHGLLYFVPWSIFVFLAIPFAWRSNASGLELIRWLVLPLAFYIILMGSTGPGLCYGPRYWVPFLPWFALATVQIMRRAQRPAVFACIFLVLLSALVAIPGALRYSQMFSQPPWAALR